MREPKSANEQSAFSAYMASAPTVSNSPSRLLSNIPDLGCPIQQLLSSKYNITLRQYSRAEKILLKFKNQGRPSDVIRFNSNRLYFLRNMRSALRRNVGKRSSGWSSSSRPSKLPFFDLYPCLCFLQCDNDNN